MTGHVVGFFSELERLVVEASTSGVSWDLPSYDDVRAAIDSWSQWTDDAEQAALQEAERASADNADLVERARDVLDRHRQSRVLH